MLTPTSVGMYSRCVLSLQILFVYFLALTSLLHPLIFNCFYTCYCFFYCPLGNSCSLLYATWLVSCPAPSIRRAWARNYDIPPAGSHGLPVNGTTCMTQSGNIQDLKKRGIYQSQNSNSCLVGPLGYRPNARTNSITCYTIYNENISFFIYSPCPYLEGIKDALSYKFRKLTIDQNCCAVCMNVA